MKQKDITLVILASVISAVLSFFVSGLLFTSPQNRQEKVEVVEEITTDFPEPSDKYFNPNALNPTQLIQIGDNPNAQPFKQ